MGYCLVMGFSFDILFYFCKLSDVLFGTDQKKLTLYGIAGMNNEADNAMDLYILHGFEKRLDWWNRGILPQITLRKITDLFLEWVTKVFA